MIADAVQIFSLFVVIVTLYFAGVQTRKLQRQLDLTNLFSRYEVLNHSSERYDAALALLFQAPELRPYVFGGKRLNLCGAELSRALIVADLMARVFRRYRADRDLDPHGATLGVVRRTPAG